MKIFNKGEIYVEFHFIKAKAQDTWHDYFIAPVSSQTGKLSSGRVVTHKNNSIPQFTPTNPNDVTQEQLWIRLRSWIRYDSKAK